VSVRKRNPQDHPDWTPNVIVVKQLVPFYGARDWWAEKAKDKDFASLVYVPVGHVYQDLYTVPAGKLLLVAEEFLTSMFYGCIELQAYTAEYTRNITRVAVDVRVNLGLVFTKPKRVTEGETLRLHYVNDGYADFASVNIGAWEVEVE